MELIKEVFRIDWSYSIDSQKDYWTRVGITIAAGILVSAIPGVGVLLLMLIVLLYWPLHIAQRLRGLGYTPWLALIYFASMALSVLPFILYFGLGLIFSGEESEGKGFQVKSGKGLALRSSQRAGEIRVDDLFGE